MTERSKGRGNNIESFWMLLETERRWRGVKEVKHKRNEEVEELGGERRKGR